MEVKIDFNEKIKISNDLVSSSTNLNIGYLFLQKLYHDLEIGSFFRNITAGSRITFDPNLVNRFLTFAGILEPDSKLLIAILVLPLPRCAALITREITLKIIKPTIILKYSTALS